METGKKVARHGMAHGNYFKYDGMEGGGALAGGFGFWFWCFTVANLQSTGQQSTTVLAVEA